MARYRVTATDVERIEIESRVNLAIQILKIRDGFLIHHETREETLSHRLAIYLEWLFPGFHVDCEYDKRIDEGEVHGKTRIIDGDVHEFRPDIIVHLRGNSNHNLLAIELKKKKNRSRRKEDKDTLEYVTVPDGEYGYQHGLFLDVDNSTQQFEKTWYP